MGKFQNALTVCNTIAFDFTVPDSNFKNEILKVEIEYSFNGQGYIC